MKAHGTTKIETVYIYIYTHSEESEQMCDYSCSLVLTRSTIPMLVHRSIHCVEGRESLYFVSSCVSTFGSAQKYVFF
jgi:hypothetical protein